MTNMPLTHAADGDIEAALERAVAAAQHGAAGSASAPRRLCEALRHAVFSGGARVRPQLCLAVARAHVNEAEADDDPRLRRAVGAGAAIELMHCASLVHDDLPCFDDAAMRRGAPSVHAAYGEAMAVLVGDALIVMSFRSLRDACADHCATFAALSDILIACSGPPNGIVAGQAWESEPTLDLRAYHRSKTGALFVAACEAGAACAEANPGEWRDLGLRLGEAYQIADDIKDVLCSAAVIGKPAGVDAALDRPNAVAFLGVDGAMDQLDCLIEDAVDAIPVCPQADQLKGLVRLQKQRLSAALQAASTHARRP